MRMAAIVLGTCARKNKSKKVFFVWFFAHLFVPLQAKKQIGGQIMLGVNSPREPIAPEFSREIRASLWRATTGNLTKEEKDAIRRGREARNKVKIVWK